MTDDEVRKWAVEWTGSRLFGNVLVGWRITSAGQLARQIEKGGRYQFASDADLAEAVRVRFVNEWTDEVDSPGWNRAIDAWGKEGPIAFCRAVKEAVND